MVGSARSGSGVGGTVTPRLVSSSDGASFLRQFLHLSPTRLTSACKAMLLLAAIGGLLREQQGALPYTSKHLCSRIIAD